MMKNNMDQNAVNGGQPGQVAPALGEGGNQGNSGAPSGQQKPHGGNNGQMNNSANGGGPSR